MLKISIFKKIWVKLFKNESSKICGRQSLKNLKWYGTDRITSNFLKAVFLNFTQSILEYHDSYKA